MLSNQTFIYAGIWRPHCAHLATIPHSGCAVLDDVKLIAWVAFGKHTVACAKLHLRVLAAFASGKNIPSLLHMCHIHAAHAHAQPKNTILAHPPFAKYAHAVEHHYCQDV